MTKIKPPNPDPEQASPSNSATHPTIGQGVLRAREELRKRVRVSELSQRRIETRSGWKRGYLSQVLQGKITLTLEHVLAILAALDVAPVRFFAEVFDPDGGHGANDEIRQKFAEYDAKFAQLRALGLLPPDDEVGGPFGAEEGTDVYETPDDDAGSDDPR
ncbi:MAG: helix-turn-helix domain-containing protein [Acidobacteriota bacterium]